MAESEQVNNKKLRYLKRQNLTELKKKRTIKPAKMAANSVNFISNVAYGTPFIIIGTIKNNLRK